MDQAQTAFDVVQTVVFLAAGAAAARMWLRLRGRPAGFLAAAFVTIGVTLLLARFFPTEAARAQTPAVREVLVIGLGAFPWLLAMFAWSFERRLPRWLLASGGAVLGLALWNLLLTPLGESDGARGAFIAVFILVWSALAGAAAVRLWFAGGTQPLVRARMRSLSVGALVLTLALLLSGVAGTQPNSTVQAATSVLSIVAAVLFLTAFAPPRPLRLWWRRRATSQWQQMQLDLIGATTAREAAGAVVPLIADMLGGGAVVISAEGAVLARAGIGRRESDDAAARVAAGEPPREGDEVVEIDTAAMVIRPTRYTPLFGQDERHMVAGFASQLRLALERAALFAAQEQARRDLQRAREEEQTMIMGLAHDLRGSSNTLRGYTGLLRSSDDPEERAEILAGIEQSSTHLEELVGALVELGRVGGTAPRKEPVDLERLVRDVVARLEPAHPDVRYTIGRLPTIEADRLELSQVFENLLTNAVTHGVCKEVTISLDPSAAPDTVTIDVRDDGRGIDPADRRAVFSLFHRGRTAASRGSGIGLNLVRRIVEAHRGTIELLDDSPGTHFRLCFPAAPDEATEDPEPLSASST